MPTTMQRQFISAIALSATLMTLNVPAAPAQGRRFGPAQLPYNRLNLTPVQREQIQSLDSQWQGHYMDLQPRMQQLEGRLRTLLATPNSDPIEITTTQQRINSLREQLGMYVHRPICVSGSCLTPASASRYRCGCAI
jgi:Spy/CpxP family protein refolding chaperone